MTRKIEELEIHLPYLRRYARALCGDEVLGDSLAENTISCSRSLLQFVPGDMEVRTWLFTVMHNLTADFFTELYGDLSQLQHLPYGKTERVGNSDTEFLDVESAITLLSLEQREVFLLITIEQMDYDHASLVLGINKARLISCLHSARKLMCNYLFSESSESEDSGKSQKAQ